MSKIDDLSRGLVAFAQDSTLVTVEMSQSSWLVAGLVPGLARQPLKKLEPQERTRIINQMKGNLARLGIRSFKPELRKAAGKLDGLRTPEGVPLPCNTLAEFRHALERLAVIRQQIEAIEQDRERRLEEAPDCGTPAMVRLLSRVHGLGLETADMLTHEVFYRRLRDERAVGRYAGMTGAPDESGSKRREKGLAKAGNARVRKGMIQLAWRFLLFQPQSPLVQWYRERIAKGARKTSAIVALARKLLIALWRMVNTGEIPQGLILRPATR